MDSEMNFYCDLEALSRKQIDIKLGKFGFFESFSKTMSLPSVYYLAGIKFIDDYLKRHPEKKSLIVVFEIRPAGFCLSVCADQAYCFMIRDIVHWTIEPQQKIQGKKNKSVIGRAVAGGVMLGPVGAIVGAISGIGTKDIQLSDVDNLVCIEFNGHNDRRYKIVLTCHDKLLKSLENFLKKFFSDKISYTEVIKQPINLIQEKSKSPINFSVADEIIKLKNLCDKGLITQEEFGLQKDKLLSQ